MKRDKNLVYYWDLQQEPPAKGERSEMPVNIDESEDEITVTAELVGFGRSEIDFDITEDTIDIVAQKLMDEDEEMFTDSIRRFFALPQKVNRKSAKAKLKGGTLTIKMKKLSRL